MPDSVGQNKSRLVSAQKTLEKRLPKLASRLAEPKWQRWALILGTSLIAAFMIAPKSFRVYNLTVGVPAPETIVSPITFKVVDDAATNKNRDEILKSVLPVYDFDDEMVHDVQSRIVAAFDFMADYMAAEVAHEIKEAEKSKEQPAPEKPVTADKQQQFRVLDENTLRTRFENLLGARVSPSSFAVMKSGRFNARIQRDLSSLIVPVLMKGIGPEPRTGHARWKIRDFAQVEEQGKTGSPERPFANIRS